MTKISSSAFNITVPMTFARGRNGDVYGVNGRERGFRWDTKTANVEQLGIKAPATPPTISSSGSNAYYIASIEVIDGGAGYNESPLVSIGGARHARARAVVEYGKVTEVVLQSYGFRYSAAPSVTLAAPAVTSYSGSGATFTVEVSGKIVDVFPTSIGSGYTSAPAITVDAPPTGGTQALLTCEISPDGYVDSVYVRNPGSGYTSAPSITFSAPPPGGTTAVGDVVMSYRVTDVTIDTAGTNYRGVLDMEFSGEGSGAIAKAVVDVSDGSISQVGVRSGGSYTTPPTVAIRIPPEDDPRQAIVAPVMAPNLIGKYWCAIRYVDSSGIPSSISALTQIELTSPAGSLAWSWSNTGMDDRVSKIELWRTTGDQALVLYRVAVVDKTATSFTDGAGDNEIVSQQRPRPCTAAASTDVFTCVGHGCSNGDTVVIRPVTGGAGITSGKEYYVINAATDTFKLSESKNGSSINVTTDMTSGLAEVRRFSVMPITLPNGMPNARRFNPPPQNKSAIVMFQDRAWYGVDAPGRTFEGTSDSTFSEPNALYFSEVDEPESVPETNQLIIQQNTKGSDYISALMPFGSGLIVFQQRHSYRLSYVEQPILDSSVALVCQRGCLNQRCWDVFDNIAYVADASGMYVLDGSSVAPISDPIESYWSDNVMAFGSSKWFFVRVDPVTRIARFFHSVSEGYPDRALCYSPVTKAWWLEQYAQTFAAADVLVSGNRQKMLVGGQAGKMFSFDTGDTDKTSADASTGIACTYRSGNMTFGANEPDRGIRFLYRPTTSDCTLSLSLHYNNSSTARPSAVSTDRGTGFVTDGGSSATLNMKLTRSALGDSTGVATCSYAGRLDDKSSGGDRHLAVNISATRPTDGPLTLYALSVGGVQ